MSNPDFSIKQLWNKAYALLSQKNSNYKSYKDLTPKPQKKIAHEIFFDYYV